MKSVKNINFKLSRKEIIIVVITLIILCGVGVYRLAHIKTSYAAAYTYTYLGVSVWNPKITAYYQDSDFYSYACKNPGSSSTTADVAVAMVAASYEADIESGAYVPSATVEINSTKIYNLGSSWNFNGVFATGTSVNHAGAWLRAINTLVNIPVADTISMGPLANSDWPTVQTKPVSVASLSDCQVETTSTSSGSSTTTSTSSSSTGSQTSTSGAISGSSTNLTKSSTSGSSTTSIKTNSSGSSTATSVATGSSTTQTSISKAKINNLIATSTIDGSQNIASVVLPAGTTSSVSFIDRSDWFWPSLSNGYSEFNTAVSPIIDGAQDGYLYGSRFYFNQASNSYTGYIGIETQGQNSTGKVAVFSITGGISTSGPGVSTSTTTDGITTDNLAIKYNWTDSLSYGLKVALTSQTAGNNTWTASITDYNNLTSTTIGSIVAPARLGFFYNQSETFTDRYSGVDSSCNIDQAEVEFSNMTANNSVSPTTHMSTTPTQTGCNNNYETEDMPGAVIQIIW